MKLSRPTNTRLLIAPIAASNWTSGPKETDKLAIKNSLKADMTLF